MNPKKWLKYLAIPIVIALLAVPMLLTGCSPGTTAEATVQTPFDQLKARMVTVESKVSLLEVELAEVDLSALETIGSDFVNLTAQFDGLVLAFGVLQESLDALVLQLDDLTLRIDDIEQGGNETETGLASLTIALAELATRVEQLEQDEPEEESALALMIIGSLPDIVKDSEEADFSIYIQNTGTSAASGQVVLQLYVQGTAVDVISGTVNGSLTFDSVTYSPSQTACTEMTFVSHLVTLPSGQGIAYTFTLYLEQVYDHWWIPTLEIAN